MISAYLDALANALSFDRALACAVRQEVEDHLCEAVAADPRPDRVAAERQAVARFGDPKFIAAQFAVTALARRARRDCAAVIVAVAATLLAMKARVAWYALQQWTLPEDVRAVGQAVLMIDRCAFWLALILGIGALAAIGRARIAATVRWRLRCAVLSCAAAIAALALAVISDGVLTALQLDMGLRPGSLLPLVLMALEIACAGAVVFLVLDTRRRVASAATLLKP